MTKADVIVVGAGPAGSSSAYFLRALGLDVLLVDKEVFPREKPCGDGVGPRSVYMLRKMGLENWIKREAFFRVEKVRLVSPQGLEISSKIPDDAFPVKYGYIVPRKDLDQKLVKHAEHAGARFLPGLKVRSLLYKNGQINGVEVEKEGRKTKVEAHLVVLAEGSKGGLCRKLGIQSFPPAVALRAYLKGVTGIDDAINIYFDKDIPQGYGWIFPLSSTSANVGIGTLSVPRKLHLKKFFFDFVNNRHHYPLSLKEAKMDSPLKGGTMKMNFGGSLIGPGLALAGDAARLVSPINGEGIAHALEAAEILAKCLENKFKSKPLINKGLEEYQIQMNGRYFPYFRWGKIFNRLFGNPAYLNKLIKKAQRDPCLAENLAGLFSNTVSPQAFLKIKHLKLLI